MSSKRLLVIGGTSFIGRHLVEQALAAGHSVTIFHRGQTGADLFPGIDRRVGDRTTGDYASLAGQDTWDACLDICAYFPRAVQQLADAVADRVGHYVQVSSISSYDATLATRFENSALWPDLAEPTEKVTGETYGPLKAMCERAAEQAFSKVTFVRPTYVAGPFDPTDRFTYWARVAAQGGAIELPHPETPLQVVDVRDLAGFLLHLAETGQTGAYDAAGQWLTVRDFVAALVPRGVEYTFVAAQPGAVYPLVSDDRSEAALMTRPASNARAAGLVTRPVSETAAATQAWDAERGLPPLRVS